METIGQRIKSIAVQRGLNLKELAKETDIPYRSIQNYSSDKQLPGADALSKLRDKLGIDLNWLLLGEERQYVNYESSAGRIDTTFLQEVVIAMKLMLSEKKYSALKNSSLPGPIWFCAALIYNKILGQLSEGRHWQTFIDKEVKYFLDICLYNTQQVDHEFMHEEEQAIYLQCGMSADEGAGNKVINPISKASQNIKADNKPRTSQNFHGTVGQVGGGDINNNFGDKEE